MFSLIIPLHYTQSGSLPGPRFLLCCSNMCMSPTVPAGHLPLIIIKVCSWLLWTWPLKITYISIFIYVLHYMRISLSQPYSLMLVVILQMENFPVVSWTSNYVITWWLFFILKMLIHFICFLTVNRSILYFVWLISQGPYCMWNWHSFIMYNYIFFHFVPTKTE